MDKFDSKIYEGPLGNVCRTHSHLIPTADYDHHRECVDQAVQSVFGTITGPILNWLLSSKLSFGTGMPPSQALLLGLREAAPEHFETILSAAKELERAAAVGSLL
jgi:hypothetical protein